MLASCLADLGGDRLGVYETRVVEYKTRLISPQRPPSRNSKGLVTHGVLVGSCCYVTQLSCLEYQSGHSVPLSEPTGVRGRVRPAVVIGRVAEFSHHGSSLHPSLRHQEYGMFLQGRPCYLGTPCKLKTVPYFHWRRVVVTELWADGLV